MFSTLCAPSCSRHIQKAPNTTLEDTQTAPGTAQGGSKRAPEAAQMPSRGAQEPSRSTQDKPRSRPEGHKGRQEAPKRPPQRLPGAAQTVQRGSTRRSRRCPGLQVPFRRLSARPDQVNDVATGTSCAQSLPKLAASTTKAPSNSTC